MDKKLYVETVTERYGDAIIASTVREAEQIEIDDAFDKFKNTGQCDHNIIYDVDGFMYDSRYCGICGNFLGFI